MKHIEGNFKGVRDVNIYYQSWLPEEDAKAVLLVVHGLGEHCGRYMNVVDHFVPLGYAIYGLDHIGHGKSAGAREIVETFEDFTETLGIFHKKVVEWQPQKPIFLLGHSMGGTIATYYLLDHQSEFKGAVISAPLVKIGESVSQATISMAKILSKIAPKMGVQALDFNAISRDPKVVEAYVNDPLVFHGKTPARLGAELLSALQRITAEAGKVVLPFILVQGAEDILVDPDGAQMFYDMASSEDKTLKIYDGLYHEVFNEPEHEIVLKDVETWLEAHL
ncbi:MAG: alpha/beta hydrolase [Anaerolineales bacterium]|nr:lysophospholipase [Chloroflexota bacterium]MBL6980815.1 alpha/beta hydrolase [Anaerolineales bacterium]